ncbi:MAG TPA: twin-arginine translocation signal domain-containing protein, partial [Sedimentisphaerales bacterium]|nr:twin-arginine translocation signal domain-containing protein [Sedimentisphaerales bacterium]
MSQEQTTLINVNNANTLTRRGFMAGAGAAALSFTIADPAAVRTYAANSKLNLGIIGCGGRGTWIT